MNKNLISILFFMSFFAACAKPEVVVIEKDAVIENKTVKTKLPAIKEFVLSSNWEFRSPNPNGELIKLTFQENDVLKVDWFHIKHGIADETKPVSTGEYTYKIRNESEIEVNYDKPLIVKKINEGEIMMNCTETMEDPPWLCFSTRYQKLAE